MRKRITLITVLISFQILYSFSQTTNTFPSSGDVGIGTTSPSAKVDIYTSSGDHLKLIGRGGSDYSDMVFYATNNSTRLGYIDWSNSATRINAETSVPLAFLTNAIERMRIDAGGNIGIGTTSPSAKLDIKGNTTTYGGMARIFLTDDNSNSDSRNWSIGNGGSAFGSLTLSVSAAKDGNPGSGGSEINAMVINKSGNIGVGNISPLAKLDIKGNTTTYDGMARIFLTDENSNSDSRNWSIGNGGSAFGNLTFSVSASKDGNPSSGSEINAMVINKSGNIGIGTTSPGSYKLAINGNVRAKEVKVETGWSDFVFHPSYKLRSLRDTEQFIKEHQHLPEIPSAKEVAENGINLGEMNAKLLQKIEELTLYVIDLKKEVDTLKKAR